MSEKICHQTRYGNPFCPCTHCVGNDEKRCPDCLESELSRTKAELEREQELHLDAKRHGFLGSGSPIYKDRDHWKAEAEKLEAERKIISKKNDELSLHPCCCEEVEKWKGLCEKAREALKRIQRTYPSKYSYQEELAEDRQIANDALAAFDEAVKGEKRD